MSKKILSEDSISKIIKRSFPAAKINKPGRELLAELMNKIHSSLIDKFDEEYENAKKVTKDTALNCVRKAVMKTLPFELRHLALSEGQRQLALYQTGHLKYDHTRLMEELKASRQVTKKSKPTKVQPLHSKFTTAVGKVNTVVSSKYKNVKLDTKAKELLGVYLYQLTKKIASTAAETVSDNELLHANHIHFILPEFFAGDILRLARTEGNRNAFLYAEGIQEFRPRTIKSLPELDEDLAVESENNTVIPLPLTVFKTGIRKLLADMNVSAKFDDGLAQVLSELSNRIIVELNDLASNQNLEEIDYTQVSSIIMEMFPPRLFQHGAYPAYRRVKDYFEGRLIYKKRRASSGAATLPPRKKKKASPKSAGRKRVKSKSREQSRQRAKKERKMSKKSAARKRARNKRSKEKSKTFIRPRREKKLNFSKSILKLFVDQFASDASFSVAFGRNGLEKLNSCLVDICKSLVADCGNEPSVSAGTVKATVAKYFPGGELGKHAIAAASRSLAMSKKTGAIRMEETGAQKKLKTEQKTDFLEGKEEEGTFDEDAMDYTEAPTNEADATEDQQDDVEVKQEVTEGALAETVTQSEEPAE